MKSLKLIEEFESKYGELHDAIISSIFYESSQFNKNRLKIILSTTNLLSTPFNYEKVELICDEIIFFRFIEIEPSANLVIMAAKIIHSEESYIFDFFPDIYSDRLEINDKSDFIIKFKKFDFKTIL